MKASTDVSSWAARAMETFLTDIRKSIQIKGRFLRKEGEF